MFIERFKKNPILIPDKNNSWEAEAVFNGCPIKYKNKTYLFYRAISLDHYHESIKSNIKISDIGIAQSKDGLNFTNRRKFIFPEYEWEKFGCEDPRVTKLNNKYFIFYTALSNWPPKPEDIKIGVAISSDLQKVEKKYLVTNFNSKAMALFPEKINGAIWGILTVNTDRPPAAICLVKFDKLEDIWSEIFWVNFYKNYDNFALPLLRSSNDHIEVGSPPIKTKYGWIVFYSYIQNYFSDRKVFGVEAVLLDLNNPLKIIGKTDFPILWPEEYYERYGLSPNIVFPSGAFLKKDKIWLYYGAADTNCAVAFIDLKILINKFLKKQIKFLKFERFKNNPILKPNTQNSWEEQAVFNPGAIYLNKKIHIIYRAMSKDNTSVFGYATTKNGFDLDFKSKNPIYIPREDFEFKKIPNANSGVEDPRLVKIGNKIYMFYTAYDSINAPRIALTNILVDDFLKQNWNWAKPVLISPPDIDDKDAAVFPEKINGYYIIIHRVGNDMDLSFHENLNFDGQTWLEEYRWLKPRPGYWDSEKVGLASPPIKTKKGWIILYHGFDNNKKIYKVGAVLADLKNPSKIISRTDYPLFEPEEEYEKFGIVNNVVFPCGSVVIKDRLYIYYGGADKFIGVASLKLKDLLNVLEQCRI